MIDPIALYQMGFMVCSIFIAVILKILIEFYPKKKDFRHRLLIGISEILCVVVISICMLLYVYYVESASMGMPAAILSIVIGGIVGSFVHAMNLIGEKKRHLTEKQKAELLDM